MKVNTDAYYAKLDAEHQRKIDEEAEYESLVDRTADEILRDDALFNEALDHLCDISDLYAGLMMLYSAVKKQKDTKDAIDAIDKTMVNIAWDYAPVLIDQRIKESEEY